MLCSYSFVKFSADIYTMNGKSVSPLKTCNQGHHANNYHQCVYARLFYKYQRAEALTDLLDRYNIIINIYHFDSSKCVGNINYIPEYINFWPCPSTR